MDIDIRKTKFRNLSRIGKAVLKQRGFYFLEWEKDTAYPLHKVVNFYFGSQLNGNYLHVKYILGIPFYRLNEKDKFPTKKQVTEVLKGGWIPLSEWPYDILSHCVIKEVSDIYKNESYVYIIKTEYKAFGYKIGKSDDPEARIKGLNVSLPFKNDLIKNYALKNSKVALRIEKALHSHFEKKRIKGEWFNLKPADLKEIDAIIKGEYFVKNRRDVYSVDPDRKLCPFYKPT